MHGGMGPHARLKSLALQMRTVQPPLPGAQPAAAAERFKVVATTIERELANQGVAALSVAVAHHGDVIWEQGFGAADVRTGRRATPHTPFSLASISKPVTATGLAVLAERDCIDLDSPIERYLGGARLSAASPSTDVSGATVRRVANHTAGLPLHYQFFFEDEDAERPPFAETVRLYAKLATPPGSHYQYSNLGYGLLDDILARRGGHGSYARFMDREIFGPLGLRNTAVDFGEGERLKAQAAVRYTAEGEPIPFYGFDHPGGSAVWSSAHDLLQFALFHLGREWSRTPRPRLPRQIYLFLSVCGCHNIQHVGRLRAICGEPSTPRWQWWRYSQPGGPRGDACPDNCAGCSRGRWRVRSGMAIRPIGCI